MTIIYTLITLAIGFTLGYLYKGKAFAEKASPFSAQDAKEGRAAIAKRIEKRKARILKQAMQKGKITNDDVEDLFCISDATARNYLNELEKEGKLAQKGSGRGTYYTIT